MSAANSSNDIYSFERGDSLPKDGLLILGYIPLKKVKVCTCCRLELTVLPAVSIMTDWGVWFNCSCGSTLIVPETEY